MSTALRRLGLAMQRAARDSGRPVVVVCGLRPQAGVTSLVEGLRRALTEEGEAVAVLGSAALASAPRLDAGAGLTLVDGGAVLVGRGPAIDPGWRPALAGVVVVVCAERDVASDADEAAALLAALELPVLGVVWSGAAAPPTWSMLDGWGRRLRGVKAAVAGAVGRLRASLSPGAPR
jgi:hypothetical protein